MGSLREILLIFSKYININILLAKIYSIALRLGYLSNIFIRASFQSIIIIQRELILVSLSSIIKMLIAQLYCALDSLLRNTLAI